jgi:hypothetical protein
MGPKRLFVAAAAALLVAAPAAHATRATLRVTTGDRELVGPAPVKSGSALAYTDDTGTPHKLPANTVLGQLLAVAAVRDLAVGIHVSSFGAFVTGIGGVAPDPNKGFWELFVNDAPSQVGADTATIHRGDRVVWLLDPDFTAPGPAFLDLTVARRFRTHIRLHVTRVDEKGGTAAAGARVVVAGRALTANASGNVTVRTKGKFNARATLAGAFASQLLTVRV